MKEYLAQIFQEEVKKRGLDVNVVRFDIDTRWDCEKSPTGKCEYKKNDKDWKRYGFAWCKHCGEPSDRP